MIHFIRPYYLFALCLLPLLHYQLAKYRPELHAFKAICSPNLYLALTQNSDKSQNRKLLTTSLYLCLFFLIFSLSGPSFTKRNVPTYSLGSNQFILLDSSEDMLESDIQPNRFARAKFKLHDLLTSHQNGQIGLTAYTEEPFNVSPLTKDGHTIDTLLESLHPQIIPVNGNNLAQALNDVIAQANAYPNMSNQVLVLTGTAPSNAAISMAKKLARHQIHVSILSIGNHINDKPFKAFANAGKGQYFPFSDNGEDIQSWEKFVKHQATQSLSLNQYISNWEDDGYWFLIPSLIFLLPFLRQIQPKRDGL